MHRIGILALLHESNTFIESPTTSERFAQDIVLFGDDLIDRFAGSHHEIGGFIQGLRGSEIVPIGAYRATPAGAIPEDTFERIVEDLLDRTERILPLDGLLIAVHGAAVAEHARDADGNFLSRVRELVGQDLPIVATLDPHANLSAQMVAACDAMTAYRTNPHLDQHARGLEAAEILLKILDHQIIPALCAEFLPLVINIERQSTDEPHLKRIYQIADRQLENPKVISNSILLGFPYADVQEMGSAVLVVTDNDPVLARSMAKELYDAIWDSRDSMQGVLISVDRALDRVETETDKRFCLLDMGDNVGGGSAADGTCIAKSLSQRRIGPSFVCIYDPQSVRECQEHNVGDELRLCIGGKTDHQHGTPWECAVAIKSFHEGKFTEDRPRHGGITAFDQGPSVVVELREAPITVLLTSRRMVPFSLNQLSSCDLDPRSFRVLVAKGVHAPLAAYREVCDAFLRVNTPGSTCADLFELNYRNRRKPLFPFEKDF
ncbi:MAG: M81 family metallopeptidase [Pirellula sp.]